MQQRFRLAANSTIILALAIATSAESQAPGTPTGWQTGVDNAVAYLRKSQEPNGGRSTRRSAGITGVVVTGLLRSGVHNVAHVTAHFKTS